MPHLPLDTPRQMAHAPAVLAGFVNHFTNYARTPFDVPTAAEAA